MRPSVRNFIVIAAIVAVFLSIVPGVARAEKNAESFSGELPIRQPWLRGNLPDDALLYVRIPNFYGLFATPKGNSLDPALRSKANVENVTKIRRGLSDNVLPLVPLLSDVRIQLLERFIRSPIEIIGFLAPEPSAMIAVNMDLASNEALYELIYTISRSNPDIKLVEPLDSDGIGQLEGVGIPLFVQFDANTGRLLISVGPGVNLERFKAQLQNTVANKDHPMRAMERKVDSAGQGFFVWLNSEQAIPAMQIFMPPENSAQLVELGLDKVRSAAFGFGVANGKGRLAFIADVPADGTRELLPFVSNDISAKSAGTPDALMLLAMPTAAEFSRIEAIALEAASVLSREEWREAKVTLSDWLGVTIEEIFSAVGPELLFIFDPSGDYAAIRVRDAALWNDITARIAKKPQVQLERRKFSGNTFTHMSWPSEFALLDEDDASKIGWFATLLRNQREHLYWNQERDFLYLASVPQPLIDRHNRKPRTDVGAWLSDTQRINITESVLAITTTNKKLPRRFYMSYIGILQSLADLAEVEIDVWSMPSADQLRLADDGALSFSIGLGDPFISMELAYESNPFEVASGGLGGVALVGIVAAIAIPAYQDYTVRAKIGEGLSLSGTVKADVLTYYLDRGQFPTAAAALQISVTEDAGSYVNSINVIAGNGTIVIHFKEGVVPGGGEITLQPFAEGDAIEWVCGGTIANKHLPAACRQ